MIFDTEIIMRNSSELRSDNIRCVTITSGIHDYIFLEKVVCKIMNQSEKDLRWISDSSMVVLSPATCDAKIIEKTDLSGSHRCLPCWPLDDYPNLPIREIARMQDTAKPAIVVSDPNTARSFLPPDIHPESGLWPLDIEATDSILNELPQSDLFEVVRSLYSGAKTSTSGRLLSDDNGRNTTFRVTRQDDERGVRSIQIVHVESAMVLQIVRVPVTADTVDPLY